MRPSLRPDGGPYPPPSHPQPTIETAMRPSLRRETGGAEGTDHGPRIETAAKPSLRREGL